MLTYLFFYVSSSLFYALSVVLRGKFKYLFLVISFLIVWLFSGLRGSVGQDTKNYSAHFDGLYTSADFFAYFGKVEPLFAALVTSVKVVFNDVSALFLVVSLIQAGLLFFVAAQLRHGLLFFLIYISSFYADFHMNVLRAGLAVLFFLAALVTSSNWRKSGLLLLMAVASHLSVLVFLPVYFWKLNLNLKTLFKIFFGALALGVVVYFFYGELLAYKFEVYFPSGFGFNAVPKTFLILSLIGVFFYSISTNVKGVIVLAFLMFAIFWVGATQVQIFHRIYSLGALTFICLALEDQGGSNYKVRPLFFYVVILGVWFSFFNNMTIKNEPGVREATGRGDMEYTLVPYNSIFSE